MTPTWTDIAQAIGSIIAGLAAVVGFWLVIKQLKQVDRTIHRDVLDCLYSRVYEIHQVVLANPDLFKYFYERADAPEDPVLRSKLDTLCEMVFELYELIVLQKDSMSKELYESWFVYMKKMVEQSPVLQQHLETHHDWYVPELQVFLRR